MYALTVVGTPQKPTKIRRLYKGGKYENFGKRSGV